MRLLRTSWPRVLQKSPISILCRCHKVETNNGDGISFPVKEQRTYKEWRSWKLYKMKSRGMIRLKGPDVLPFLQGLVTNDVFQMMGEVESMYTMMLNSQVRCMGNLKVNIIQVLHYMYLVTAVRQKKFSSSTMLQREKTCAE